MKSSLTDTQNYRKPFEINVDDVDINTVVCIKTSFLGDDLEHIEFTTAWLYTPARMSNFSKLYPPPPHVLNCLSRADVEDNLMCLEFSMSPS